MTDMINLTPYKGRDVLSTSIAIRRAGDGLSAAMGIDPVELTLGEHVFVVLDCVVAHHDYGPIKDTDCLELKQVLNAEAATLVEEDLVRKHLDEQRDRVRLAREEAEGTQRIVETNPDGSATAESLESEHAGGGHADGLRRGCPLCDAERDAVEAEGGLREPWDGYEDSSAREVIGHVKAMSDAGEAQLVSRWEGLHGGRSSVVQAALKRAAELGGGV